MKKTDNYGAIVKIENIVGDLSKVDENSLFTLLTRLAIKKGRIFDMGIILASRDDKYSGHVELAEKRLPSQSTSIQSPFQSRNFRPRNWQKRGRGLGTEFTFNIAVVIITICILFLVGRVDLG